MVLDHVAHGTDVVVVAGAEADALLLRRGDQDRLDQVAVPDRLEQRIRETQREHVLDRVLREVVVDAIDLFLVERCSELQVQLARRREVVPERLLDDDAPRRIALGGHARLTDRAEDVRKRLGRGRQVEDRGRRAVQQLLHRSKARGIAVVELHPLRAGGQLGAAARLVDDVAELLLRLRAAARADHAQHGAVAIGQAPQGGQDLAPGEVA